MIVGGEMPEEDFSVEVSHFLLSLTLNLQLNSSFSAAKQSSMLQSETLEVKSFLVRPGGVYNNRLVTPDMSHSFSSLPLEPVIISDPRSGLSTEKS